MSPEMERDLTAETQPREPRPRLRRTNFLRELLEMIIFVVAIYALVEMAAPRFMVEGPSMEPTFYTNQRLLVSRLSYLYGEPSRGEIVVFNVPGSRPQDPPLIKRVVGLPGERIEMRERSVYINGVFFDEPYINEPCNPVRCPNASWDLAEDEYFLMGDNRNRSRDSREFGPVPFEQLIGEALIRYWPPDVWAIVDKIRFPAID